MYYFKVAINKIFFDQGTKERDNKMLEWRKSMLKRVVISIVTTYPEFLADKIDNYQLEVLIKKTGKVKYYMSLLGAKILKNNKEQNPESSTGTTLDPVLYAKQIVKVYPSYKKLTY